MKCSVLFSFCVFLLVVNLDEISCKRRLVIPRLSQVDNNNKVTVVKSKGVNETIKSDTMDAFKRAYTHLNSNSDRCSIVRQILVEKYPEYKWQIVMFKSYSIQSVKSLEVRVNDQDNYIVFATNGS